ncbi:molybdopterin molybdenumtransferase MoeA [Streptomyces alkaliphilus]|uniref:Molybdopterin molybdenumtransferase n=1 Tax=Streptomyces alkaliphilus TaxID=1472722 RepID=A0A7W3TFM2_9ACTN|nr:gephyrin-like molybdotransferase Glp [Streptomyces alkaliphilus]MBB0245640.1 molybdopterin molybdenumtransferase MoeA [Streptomyces alkaliphilus]
MADIRSVDEHLAEIVATVRPLDPIELPLSDAYGCVLTEDVTVPVALPSFDNSSMDGYAVRVADLEGADERYPAVLEVIGDAPAGGDTPAPTVGPGRAVRIMTGAPLPPGAEAVVPVEWTDGGTGGGPAESMAGHGPVIGGEVRVHRPVSPGQHVRRRGGDVAAGALALAAGTLLTPPRIGLLAAVGRASVPVRPRPRVAVISTGSELVPPGRPLAPGRIHDSNGFALAAAVREAGGEPYRVAAVVDDPVELRAVLTDQMGRADLIITTGGVSVGAYDVVKAALSGPEAPPGSVEFHRLAMQPGKPQGFGVLVGAAGERVPLLALPGNPVSAYVSFELFVRPAMRVLAGRLDRHRPRARAVLAAEAPLTSPKGKRQFLRGALAGTGRGAPVPDGPAGGSGRADGSGGATGDLPGGPVSAARDGLTVSPVGGAGSHLVAALARADCLIVVPEEVTEVAPGTGVEVVLLDRDH